MHLATRGPRMLSTSSRSRLPRIRVHVFLPAGAASSRSPSHGPSAPMRCGSPCSGRPTGVDAPHHDHRLVTMVFKQRRIPAGEFKARCLALLDEVAATGTSIVVTKYGKPVAKVVPLGEADDLPTLRGSVVREGDIVSPIDVRWKADR